MKKVLIRLVLIAVMLAFNSISALAELTPIQTLDFSKCASGEIPLGWTAYNEGTFLQQGTTSGAGPRIFIFADGGDVKNAYYFRTTNADSKSYIEYDEFINIPANTNIRIQFYCFCWKGTGLSVVADVYDTNGNIIASQEGAINETVNGNTGAAPKCDNVTIPLKFNTDKPVKLRITHNAAIGGYEELMLGKIVISQEHNDAEISVDNVNTAFSYSEQTINIPVRLQSETDITSFQTDLYIPNGLELVDVVKGQYATSTHNATVVQKNGYYRVVFASSKNEAFTTHDGEIALIKLRAPAMSEGKYYLQMKNIYLSDLAKPANKYHPSDCISTIDIEKVKVNSITLDKTDAEMLVGANLTLTATVLPENATEKAVTWKSSNNNIATVTDGYVVAKNVGDVVITATTIDGSNLSASCNIKVNPILATSVSLNQTNVEILKGGGFMLTTTVLPENATNKAVTWRSSDTNVATVVNGFVKGVGIGNATITATTMDGSNKTATCAVTVKPVLASSITLNKSSIELLKGANAELKATVLPDSTTNKAVAWTSSDETVATVKDGKIHTLKVGEAIITAKTMDGTNLSASCTVTVKHILATSIKLNKSQAEMLVGAIMTLTATVLPDSTENKVVTWKSSNEAIAKVNNGVVKALDLGEVVITATTTDGSNLSAVCIINVMPVLASSITLDKKSAGIVVGENLRLTATVLPDSTTNKAVTWVSSNANVAKVVNGLVTGTGVGNAVITAKTADGTNLTATCNVTVNPVTATSINLDKRDVSLLIGGVTHLTATVLPDSTTNKNVTWSSGDNKIAKVDANGYVTGVGVGSVYIIATTADGSNLKASCKVTVNPVLATSISFNKQEMELAYGGKETLIVTFVPDTTTNKTVAWSSSDNTTVIVNNNGEVTAIGYGTAVITATTTDGTNLSAHCTVNVVNSINFADSNVKAICINYWDTNHDGELSVNEAKAVTSLNGVFKGNQKIMLFDELKSFTGLQSITANDFTGCSNLTKISLPDNLGNVAKDAFKGCDKLLQAKQTDATQVTATIKVESGITSNIAKFFAKINGVIEYCNEEGVAIVTNLAPGQNPMTIAYGAEYNDCAIYENTFKGSTKSMNPTINATSTPTTIDIACGFEQGDAEILQTKLYDSTTKQYVDNLNSYTVRNLDPETNYTFVYEIQTKSGNQSVEQTIKTTALSLITKDPKVTSNTTAVVCAHTNITDEMASVGFEWRKTDAPDVVPSKTGPAVIYEGEMEGKILGLTSTSYYKVRAYYKSDAEKMYYGEWIGFDPSDFSYFEPTVHTYDAAQPKTTDVDVKGYAMPGSDDVTEQGFEYWIENTNAKSEDGVYASDNVQKITSTGQLMMATLPGLNENTKYMFRAYVITEKGTTYGELKSFITPDNGLVKRGDANNDKVVDVADITTIAAAILGQTPAQFNSKNADANGDGVIDVADITTVAAMILGK